VQRGAAREGEVEFAWREEVIATPNAAFRRVDIRVFASGDEAHSLARLVGFVVNAPGASR